MQAQNRRTRVVACWLIASTLGAAVVGCSTVRTNVDFDPSTDFSGWKTYAWYPAEALPEDNSRRTSALVRQRVEDAVDRRLQEKGFQKVTGDVTPDFYVNFHLAVEDRLRVRNLNQTYVWGPHGAHWRGAGWRGPTWNETVVDQYEQGTLIIDIVDPARRQLVWRGTGSRRLARNPSPEQITSRVNAAVDEVLARFPPGA